MNEPTIRMFVDENGHQTLKGDLSLPDKRFLCITGVIMPLSVHDNQLTKRLNALKVAHFGSENVVLHRRELISAKPPFEALLNQDVRERFDQDFLAITQDIQYRVISVVIDKKALIDLHGPIRAQDPYALALEYLMQRYQYWMQDYQAHFELAFGDMMAEARGGSEDMLTKRTYNAIYQGKGYNPLRGAEKFYSSSQIKVKPKKDNIPGLQFVDLLSHAARRHILSTNGLAVDIKRNSFEQHIVDILLQSKFRRSTQGNIEGYGTVFYPKQKAAR